MARYAISDIHGCIDTFRELLNRIGLSKDDELYLLGDYIDRGPNSMGVIEKIWELQNDGYRVDCLRGNHEAMLMDPRRPDYENNAIPHGRRREVIKWMNTLKLYLESPGYFFVHAGLYFGEGDPLRHEYDMLWKRYWYDDLDRDWLGDRVIVHGHTPQNWQQTQKQIDELDRQPIIDIDTGCFHSGYGLGYLSALNLDSLELTPLRRIDSI